MQPVSQDFLNALTGSVTPIFKVDAYYDDEQVAGGTDLTVTGGQVTFDANAQIRGTCQLMVSDPDGLLVPKKRTDALAPFGAELNIRAGLDLPNGPELVSLGWFRLGQTQPAESWRWAGPSLVAVPSGATIQVSGSDRMQLLLQDLFLTPDTPKSADMWTEIVRLVAGLVPVQDPGMVTTIPNGAITYGLGASKLDAITQLAQLASAHPVITRDGSLTLLPDTPVSSAADWALQAGPSGNMGFFTPQFDASQVFNGISVQGTDPAGNPLYATLTQPDGPLAWNGPFGRRLAPAIQAPELTTQAAVNARASSELAKALVGVGQTMDIPTVPNFALELEDIVSVQIPDRASDGLPVSKLVMPQRGAMTTTVTIPNDWVLNG